MIIKTAQRNILRLLVLVILPCLSFALAGQACAGEAKGQAAQLEKAQAKPAVPGFSVAVSNESVFRLSNGLTVYLIEDKRFPMVCTRLYVRTGSTHEAPEQFGISHVLEHMVFKGTKTRPTGQIAKEVEALGGYLNAYTSFDKTCYLTDMPSKEWKTGIDIVRDMAFNPLLDAGELEREKPVIISEMEGKEDEPGQRLFLEIQKASLKGTPYGHPIIGTRETVKAVTPESLRAYIDRWYQPQNMMLLVAGDMDVKAVQAYIEEGFGSLANKDVFDGESPVELSSIEPEARTGVTRGAWNKVYLQLAFPVAGLKDYNALHLDMLSMMLAGDATSLFERKYRLEKHLVDSIDVSNAGFSRLGLFEVSVVMDADKTGEVFASLVRDLRDLSMKSFSQADLDRARLNTLDSYDRAGETLSGLTSWRGMMQLDLGGRQGEANIRAFIDDIDLESIGRTYAQYAIPSAVRVCALVPQKAEIPDLAAILDKEWPVPAETKDNAKAKAQEYETLTLDNGMRIVLQPDTATPYFSLTLMAQGGNALVDARKAGLPQLAAALLGDGAGDMDKQAFERKLSEKAISLGASASRSSFSLAATGPVRYTDDLLGLLKTMMTEPRFDKQELAREVRDMNAARTMRDEDPMGRLSASLWPMLFGSHPYGLDSLGSKESLASFTREDVAAFWKKQSSMPWVLSVTGSYDREAILAFARSFAKPASKEMQLKAPAWGREKSLTVSLPDKNKAHVAEVFATVPRTHPDAPALMMLDAILSGQSGLLFSQMRDKDSLGYTVTSQCTFFPTTGLLLFYAGTEPGKIDDVKAGFAGIIKTVCDKDLSPELLEAGWRTLEGQYVRARQSLGARSAIAASEVLLGQPRDFGRVLLDKAKLLKPADIRRVAATYLHDGYEVIVRP